MGKGVPYNLLNEQKRIDPMHSRTFIEATSVQEGFCIRQMSHGISF